MNTNRRRRARIAEPIAGEHGGVVSRTALSRLGVSRDDVRTEIRAGRWSSAGRHTVVIGGDASIATDLGRWWWAVWESGSGAALDGATALLAGGLTGFSETQLHVNVPPPNACYRHSGVRVHRRRVMGPLSSGGPPRARLDWATIRAAQWAVSDRQAALIVAMSVQQRLIRPAQLLATWREVHRSRRRQLLDQVIPDVCDGGHHQLGLAPMDDALRANEVTLSGSRVIRIPLLGLRLAPDAFLNQVARALDGASAMQKRSHLPRSA